MTVTNTAIPVLTGTAQQGHTLTTNNGSWTFDLDYLTYTYEWLRCDAAGANCVAIGGATGNQLGLTALDVGHTIRSQVTATEHSNPPPPPPSGNPYTSIDFAAGLYNGEGLTAIFESYAVDARLSSWGGTDPPCYDAPAVCGLSPTTSMTTDTNQRVYLFQPGDRGLPTAPNGSGYASWHELRSTDTYWQAATPDLAKSSLESNKLPVTWGPSGFSVGAVRWFAWDILFPLNIGGVSFEFRNSWHTIFDLHASYGVDGDPCLGDIRPYGSNPRYLAWTQTPDTRGGVGVPYLIEPLVQLTNGDGSRYAANYNVWHEIVVGARYAKDSSGWYELWVDGAQVVAQTQRVMLNASENGPYVQMQNYTAYPTSFVGGATRSAVVYGGFRAGLNRSDVQLM